MKKISFAFLVPLLLVLLDVVPLGRSEIARSAVRFAAAATPQEVITTTSSSTRRGAGGGAGNLLVVPRELKGGKSTKAAAKKMKSSTKHPKAPKTVKRPKAPKKSKSGKATALTASPTNKSAASPSLEPPGEQPMSKPSSSQPTVKPSSQRPTVKPSSQPTNPFDWKQKGLDIDGEALNDNSGRSVSFSSDGTVLAIAAVVNDGANGIDSGHVRVYEWNTGTSSWVQKGADIDGEAANDQSGWSVSLSSDGTVLAIGAFVNDGANGIDSGHVRVYEWNDTGTSSWVRKGADIDGEAANDWFGVSVSLSSNGNVLAIGAVGNDVTGSNSGHVRVYEWNGSSWGQKGANIDGVAAFDYTGRSVSLSSNGTVLAIGAVGAYGNDGYDSNSGHVRVYEWNTGTSSWVQKGTDMIGEAAEDHSGWSVSLSSDGTVLAIGAFVNDGANGIDSGHVRVYEWNTGTSSWVRKGADIDGEAANDWSGWSVSLSSDGLVLAIGALFNDGANGSNSGHVRVYEWNAGTSSWVQKGDDIDGEAAGDQSGRSVSLSSDGTVLAIGGFLNDGANGADSGHVRVYEFTNLK